MKHTYLLLFIDPSCCVCSSQH